MEISKNQQFILITLIILSLAVSTALLINPRLGRALVTKPFHTQPSQTGQANLSQNSSPNQKASNLDQVGHQASVNLSSK